MLLEIVQDHPAVVDRALDGAPEVLRDGGFLFEPRSHLRKALAEESQRGSQARYGSVGPSVIL